MKSQLLRIDFWQSCQHRVQLDKQVEAAHVGWQQEMHGIMKLYILRYTQSNGQSCSLTVDRKVSGRQEVWRVPTSDWASGIQQPIGDPWLSTSCQGLEYGTIRLRRSFSSIAVILASPSPCISLSCLMKFQTYQK